MELPAKYLELKKEVETYYEEFQSDEKLKSKTDKYYKGIQILFSPLIIRPKIMFIGINPGAGFFNTNNRYLKRFSPLENSEYLKGEYRLAQQTRKLFEMAELTSDDLKKSVKSNCFFFATTNEKELHQFLSHLKPSKVYTKSEKWIDKLVKLIKPKIIICEGKSAFNQFVKNKDCEIKDKDNVLFTEWNSLKIIGYKRNFSNILGIKNVANKLKYYAE
ncbi:hypothetical protein IMCC3317_13920 [Kordia antarctica]|uniref:Uracil-DNA glycosylase-like domain-containing protein n=1 Tax=Kordia antarctica TaxID=1218801 RepID=A0A7L4ZHY6_9FLAO|nr:hypothetical protein [Kordia antarctica]QHI36039.1 hypothetical protein IMCC3317_13920 [Kordia antarctica]